MNRNILKSIACISMLIDHIGYLLFPNILIFRLIGRLAMPIFSFFIAEGCRHTSNRFRYFLRIFLLGLLCQTVYIAQELLTSGKITPQSSCLYLNILLTFSLSIPICFSFLHFENMRKETQSKKISSALTRFIPRPCRRRHPDRPLLQAVPDACRH